LRVRRACRRGVEQRLLAERLGQELDGTRLQQALARVLVSVSGQDD